MVDADRSAGGLAAQVSVGTGRDVSAAMADQPGTRAQRACRPARSAITKPAGAPLVSCNWSSGARVANRSSTATTWAVNGLDPPAPAIRSSTFCPVRQPCPWASDLEMTTGIGESVQAVTPAGGQS